MSFKFNLLIEMKELSLGKISIHIYGEDIVVKDLFINDESFQHNVFAYHQSHQTFYSLRYFIGLQVVFCAIFPL